MSDTPRGDTFHVPALGIVKPMAPHALTVAQRAAEEARVPVLLTVERHSRYGPPVVMYSVQRLVDGRVVTHTLEAQD